MEIMMRHQLSAALLAGVVSAASAGALFPTGAAAGALGAPDEIDCVDDTDPTAGSCNSVFRDRSELAGLTTAELLETVALSCPSFEELNSPYQRVDISSEWGYVLKSEQNPTNGTLIGLSAQDIDDQIGTELNGNDLLNEAGGTDVILSGFSGGSTSTVTIKQVDADIRGQILDLPGADFFHFVKSQGGSNQILGTLVCNIKPWFRDGGIIEYGIKNFTVNHGIQALTIGWLSGPSGLKNQVRAKAACAAAGNDDSIDADLQKKVSFLYGGYKLTGADPTNLYNVTGCGLDSNSDPVVANYCNQAEAPGTGDDASGNSRPNSCIPEGGVANVPEPLVNSASGNATCITFYGRGGGTICD